MFRKALIAPCTAYNIIVLIKLQAHKPGIWTPGGNNTESII